MKARTRTVTLMLILSLLVSGLVSAQDDDMGDFDPCFGLAEADCAVINDASANGLNDAQSFSIAMDINFVAENVPDESLSTLTFTQVGSLDVIVNPDATFGADIHGSFEVSYSQGDADLENQQIEFSMVDETFYFTQGSEWLSIDLAQVMESDEFKEQFEAFGIDLDDFMNDPENAELDEEQVEEMQAGLLPLMGIIDLPGFITYERSGDDFVFTVDMSVLQALLEEENEDLINDISAAAAQIDPTLAFMLPAIPALIQSGTIEIVQSVNTADNYVEGIDFNLDLTAALGAMFTGDTSMPPTQADLAVTIDFVNIDSVETIVAPENATDITQEVLESTGDAENSESNDN